MTIGPPRPPARMYGMAKLDGVEYAVQHDVNSGDVGLAMQTLFAGDRHDSGVRQHDVEPPELSYAGVDDFATASVLRTSATSAWMRRPVFSTNLTVSSRSSPVQTSVRRAKTAPRNGALTLLPSLAPPQTRTHRP